MSASSSPTPFPHRPAASRPRLATLPAPLTPILGRDDEIAQVVRLLDRDDLRIVTLLGPGGVGKTRLAQEVARIVEPHFAHGACFVPLAAIRDPELVPKAVAQTLGIQESKDRLAVELLNDVLADRHLLLVLNNLEQVITSASPWLFGLLARCPRLTVLVTSRIALDIAGEQRMLVPPLPVPAAGEDVLERHAAVALFTQRAQAVDLSFHLNERNTGAVAEICRRLDGLPLAIELAAARVKVLSPDAILARLANRLTLLAGGRRDVPARLQSMRLFEVLSRRNPEVCSLLMAANAINHTPAGTFGGPDGFERFVAEVWSPFPDAIFAIEDRFADGDIVTLRWTMLGHHHGNVQNHVVSGVPVYLEGLAILRFEQNMIVESWIQYDRMSLLEQIEATPGEPRICPPCQEP